MAKDSIDYDKLAIQRVSADYGHRDDVQRVLVLARECLTRRAQEAAYPPIDGGGYVLDGGQLPY